MKISRPFVLLLGIAFLSSLVSVRAQQPGVEDDLEEAKGLYREAKFAQAIARLQRVVARLEPLVDARARDAQADAHLHLALSYIALNDPAAAKESLKAMLRLEPARRLDPQVYAPKVIAVFEEASNEVAKEPPARPEKPSVVALPPKPSGATPRPAPPKKGGSKTPFILLGVGGAAVAGIAIASSSSSDAPIPNDITLVGTEPPPGATISFTRGPRVFVRLLVSKARPQRGIVVAALTGRCMLGGTETPPFEPGPSVSVDFALNIRGVRGTNCEGIRPPLHFDALRVALLNESDSGFPERALVAKTFPINYTFVE